LSENRRLRLEHLWRCEECGRKSMTREELKKTGDPIFQETVYGGTQWFRFDQVQLDEPCPEAAVPQGIVGSNLTPRTNGYVDH